MIPPALSARYALQGVWLVLIGFVVVASLLFGVYHKLLIDGYKFLFFESEGYRPAYERVLADNERILAAQEEAERLQRQINEQVEAGSAEASERIDRETYEEVVDQLARAEQFIRSNRVRQGADRCPRGATAAPAQDHGSGSGQATGAAPVLDGAEDYVVVRAGDVRICTVNTLQAEAGREFALEIEKLTSSDN